MAGGRNKSVTPLHGSEASQIMQPGSKARGGDIVSAKNGDKARFDRERKKNNLRRRRTQELRKKLQAKKAEAR
jgi:hypothetical protein